MAQGAPEPYATVPPPPQCPGAAALLQLANLRAHDKIGTGIASSTFAHVLFQQYLWFLSYRKFFNRSTESQKELIPKKGNSTFASQSTIQDVGMFQAQKSPQLDIMQHWLQRHCDLQVQVFGQPSRLSQIQHHQTLQSLPQLQRIQMHPQSQTPRSSLSELISTVWQLFESRLCSWRLLQYMYHRSHRLVDNSLLYWRKFVVEYFSPRAKKRWCFALHNSAGNHAFGAFPRASKVSYLISGCIAMWQCGVCGSQSGKGYGEHVHMSNNHSSKR
ncbi:hypothetical protein KSP40_PGU010603 [Platanthera guangdongensis]|uniref:Maturase K n=1 Tax=Platanthera guangdongensis TaxID=2320717 RepID=A0ABR2LSH0_9ASPA